MLTYHPMTQGKIERWHQTLKNRILLESYFLPGDLEAQIAAFIDDYNHRRYHESLENLTPADVFCGRGPTVLAERQRIKRQTIANRRLQHRLQAASLHHLDAPEPPLIYPARCLKNSDDGRAAKRRWKWTRQSCQHHAGRVRQIAHRDLRRAQCW
jgi:hypothetical protein